MHKDAPSTPARHKTFGISDSLLNARPKGYKQPEAVKDEPVVAEEPKLETKQQLDEAAGGKYVRPGLQSRDRKIARKSSTLRSKGSVASNTTARFKQRHAGTTVPTRKGTEGQPRATGATATRGGSKRPVGGMGAVHHDLGNQPEADFRRKYGKSKSAMRTGLRGSYEMDGENDLNEMNITVQMNPGGTTYKVLSVSADIGSRIKVGENLTDTHIDDLRDSDVSISYKGGKGGMKKMESKEVEEGKKKKNLKAFLDVKIGNKSTGIGSINSESVDLDAANVELMLRHDCANHVRHPVHGEGVCVPGEHTLEEISEGEGIVSHYDVMFEDGIKEDIPVYELEILSEALHSHASKKKGGKKVLMDKKKKKNDDNGDNGDDNGDNGDEDTLDPVDPKALKGTHDDRGDGDIDNDGDEDDSDKFLHKKRKAITKKMKKEDVQIGKKRHLFKEWVAIGSSQVKTSEPKNAMHAHSISKHFYQIAVRDDMFGKEKQFKENMGLAKKFYAKYQELQAKGDSTAEQVFKDGADKEIENFSETATSQTNESWYEPAGQARGDHVRKPAPKVAKITKHTSNPMRTSIGTKQKIKPQYNTDTHKLVKKKGKPGLKTVSKDTKLGPDEYEAEEVQHDEALTKFGPSMDKHLADKDRAQMKAQGTIKMRQDGPDGIHGTTVQKTDTAKIAALKAKGYRIVSESSDQNPNIPYPPDEAKKLAAKKERDRKGKTHFQGFNDRRDKGIKSKPIDKNKFFGKTKTGGVQNEDLKEVEFEGEIIYESFDSTNMPEHAPEVVEMTPDAYDYNRSSWVDALAEVNRYKGKSGHRVTQPDKSGDEHIIMQLRKAVTIGPNHTGVKFKDGETHKISAKTAQKHLDHYNTLKPEDKIKWQNSASHSHSGLSSASGEKKLGQAKPKSAFKRDEPTRQLINPMDKD